MTKISIVICVYNEEDNIIPLVKQIHEALSGSSYEIIYVDDGSTDSTVAKIKALSKEEVQVSDMDGITENTFFALPRKVRK